MMTVLGPQKNGGQDSQWQEAVFHVSQMTLG